MDARTIETITIPDTAIVTKAEEPYVVYNINVTLNDRSSWIISRRFSQFAALHNYLPDDPEKPSLPSKFSFKKRSPPAIEERRQKLEAYLQAMFRIERLRQDLNFCEFIGEDRMASPDASQLTSFSFAFRSGAYHVGNNSSYNRVGNRSSGSSSLCVIL